MSRFLSSIVWYIYNFHVCARFYLSPSGFKTKSIALCWNLHTLRWHMWTCSRPQQFWGKSTVWDEKWESNVGRKGWESWEITGEMGMSSLLLRCLRREPSAGEIVPQIRSEARLQRKGLQLRNRSKTNRGQSSCLEPALPPTQENTRAKEKKRNGHRDTKKANLHPNKKYIRTCTLWIWGWSRAMFGSGVCVVTLILVHWLGCPVKGPRSLLP